MYKLALLLTPSPELAIDDVAERWDANPEAPRGLVGRTLRVAVGSESPIATASTPPYAAVEEYWWERKVDAADWFGSREFRDEWMPPRRELLERTPAAIGGTPSLSWEASIPEPPTALTVIVLPVALRRLTVGELREKWLGAHAALALAGPGTKDRLLRLENTPSEGAPSVFDTTPYDGFGALTFASADALAAEFSGEYYRTTLVADEGRFATPGASGAIITRRPRS